MAGPDPNDRIPSERSSPVPPVNRLAGHAHRGPGRGPEALMDESFVEALRRKVLTRGLRGTGRRPAPPPPTAEDLRLHAWLTGRLAAVGYERHGLWPRFRRLLLGNRLVRWLGRLAQKR
jgi:hypothetical protein